MKQLLILLFGIMTAMVVPTIASGAAQHCDDNIIATFSFDENEFYLSPESNDLFMISGTNDFQYSDDQSAPCLPWVIREVQIPVGTKYKIHSLICDRRLVKTDCRLSTNLQAVPTNYTMSSEVSAASTFYSLDSYPEDNCIFSMTSSSDDGSIIYFLISPYIYDAKDKNLYFIDQMCIEIELEEDFIDFDETNMASYALSNTTDVNSTAIIRDGISIGKEDITFMMSPKYVIITSPELEDALLPLAQWKTQKGVPTRVISTSDNSTSSASGIEPSDIKNTLSTLRTFHKLEYVLLAGDIDIVPSKACHVKISSKYDDYSIPTDLYYACLGGSFDWDADGNGFAGEPSDGISLKPSLYVSRVPIRTVEDANVFVKRQIDYEKGIGGESWNNSILMAGRRINQNTEGSKDAMNKGNYFYHNFIQPYWDGELVQFYDCGNNLGYDYAFNATNINNLLNNGHMFFDMISHGGPQCWWFLNKDYYWDRDAAVVMNPSPMIITTIACDTNAFDSVDDFGYDKPCLSETFIRNPNSGVIGYLGCSRSGWTDYYNHESGTSDKYQAKFFDNLFSDTFAEKNYGKLVAEAKYSLAPNVANNSYMRWVQYGLNPLGDPEMPVFTSNPQIFTDIEIETSNDFIKINSPINLGAITISSEAGTPYYYHYYKSCKDVNEASFSKLPKRYTLTLSKQDYAPKIYHGFNQEDGNYVYEENLLNLSKPCQILSLSKENRIINIEYRTSDSTKKYKLAISRPLLASIPNYYDLDCSNEINFARITSPSTGLVMISILADDVIVETKKIII